MPVIHVLDQHVAELIAAGEVVERPASVVKELMENSIDAGASSIVVEIQNGGITYLRITDDGCGIGRSDVKNAFLRHATSKIQTEDDLDKIGTLGFRGEALASIAAVSRIEMITRAESEDTGTRIALKGGEIEGFDDAGCPKGTTIIVRDLFFNTPARMKFLKKDVSEGNAVASVVEKIALSHPEVSIRFLRDHQEKLYTPGDNHLISTLYSVFGKKFSEDLLPVDYTQGNLQLRGYISKPFAARANRTMQNFFVNHRFVKSKTCMVALEEGYKHSMMVGKFPACVLYLKMPENTVDVNVHPAKIEVRFENEKKIFDLVYYGVKSAIMQSGNQPNIPLTSVQKKVSVIKSDLPVDMVKNQIHLSDLPDASANDHKNRFLAGGRASLKNKEIATSQIVKKDTAFPLHAPESVTYTLSKKHQEKNDALHRDFSLGDYNSQETPVGKKMNTKSTVSMDSNIPQCKARTSWRLVGEVFHTYIILEQDDQVVFIDKHAAHERLLFNRLKAGLSEMDLQFLLSPVMITLSKAEHEAVCDHISVFSSFGFDVEDFGDSTILVRSAPMMLDAAEIENCVCEIATAILENKKDLTPTVMEDLYHSISCKAAMKAHDQRNELELRELVTLLEEDEDAKFCPHGRPVSIVVSEKDLEKRFGRQ